MTATNEEMEIEATAEKAGFSVEEPITSNTIAVNVSADTYERLISCAEVEETLDKTINRIMDEIAQAQKQEIELLIYKISQDVGY